MQQPTIREVAEKAGVALSSVSRALNDHPDVSEKLRVKVLAAADALGYVPDLVAQGLRRGATFTVGFVVRDISNPLFADIVKGTEDTLRRAGYSILLTNSEGEPELDARHIRLFRQRRVDGIVLSLESETNPETLEALRSIRGPLVLIDREVPGLEASAVLSDHHIGVRAAVTHMLQVGHARIGFIGGPRDIRASRDRLRGFDDAHRLAGRRTDESLLRFGEYTKEFGYEQTQELLALESPPTAILAGGIQLAFGALTSLHERGTRIGRDISFATCDEIDLMHLFDPPISAVTRDTVRMGQVAAELLLERLTDDKPPRTEVLPTRYLSRGSVTPPGHEA